VYWSKVETRLGKESQNARFRLYVVPTLGWVVAAEGDEPWLEFRKVGDTWLLAKWARQNMAARK